MRICERMQAHLCVTGILKEHVGRAGLGLRLEHSLPHFARAHHLARLARHGLILQVQLLEGVRVRLSQAGRLVRAEQRPRRVRLHALTNPCRQHHNPQTHDVSSTLLSLSDSSCLGVACFRLVCLSCLHEEVVDPQSVEKVSRALLLNAVVLLELKEGQDVGVPRLEVDGERACTQHTPQPSPHT
jgi:hypothetical protein